MVPEQRPPIRVEAQKSDTTNPATFIFLHGYDDDGEGFVSKYIPIILPFLTPIRSGGLTDA